MPTLKEQPLWPLQIVGGETLDVLYARASGKSITSSYWSKYPIDLPYDFAQADSRCRDKQRDRMPHIDHLARWTEWNRVHRFEITDALAHQLCCKLRCANRIGYWAYEHTENAGGLTWLRRNEVLHLNERWREYLNGRA